ncbi:LruC domain-containing protein [Pedobacter sp. JY14-1]|uniref:LruC domain-containing protein n=1 Tax=Pedobacter sp. JY14-1 TaxID=3034151 RepID=UPI0023E22EFA|nr:LruC domain-containing protein [Pedobacter sp. JY14-1]
MKIKLLSVALLLAVAGTSCKKSIESEKSVSTGLENLNVPGSFDWSTTQEINFSIGTSDSRFQNQIHVIYIYDQDPAKGGKILAKGATTLVTPFNTRLAFASATREVYILKSAPNGVKTGQNVSLNSKNVSVSFGAAGISSLSYSNTDRRVMAAPNSGQVASIPDCQRSTTDANINVGNFEVVCFNATANATVDINGNNGGTVRLNAPGKTITLRNFNHTNMSLVVEPNTKLVVQNTEIKTNETWTINGTLEVTGKLDVKGTLSNYGTATINNLQMNSQCIVNNYCKLLATDLIADNILNNYSYVAISNAMRINSNGRVNLIGGTTSGAYLETKNLDKGSNQGRVVGSNATGLFKVTGNIDNNLILDAKQTSNSQVVAGNLELCTNVQNLPAGFFLSPAKLGCEAYIEKGDCMLAGNGTAPTTGKDSDGDGVMDDDDDYKDDKDKAFNTYSVNYKNGGSTLAFEDNWPTRGDYDLNDVVLTYRYKVVTNATNKVVEVNAGYTLIATGADYINGAGVQFPLAAGKAKLTKAPAGVYLEDKQDSVVLILFDNSRKLQATGNTVLGNPTSPKVDFDIVFTVADGPEIKNFGALAYNPFIFNMTNGFGRGYETHLYGKKPTNLVNSNLFETKDDYSKSNNKYYSTKDRLPWAIEVPIADFGYPVEGKRIDNAYTNFANWATSGGSNSQEWYDLLSGGANKDLIYKSK